MQKVVIDTNVIVSSLIQPGYPHYIIKHLFIENKFQLCVSDELLIEYYEVLHRPRFEKYHDFLIRAEMLFTDIVLKAAKFIPTIKLNIISDPDDNMILELADKCAANFIITGNTTDFTSTIYKKTKIVTPKEYWENYQPK